MRGRLLALAATLTVGATAGAADLPTFNVAIESHVFLPAEIRVPAGQKFRLSVENRDPTPEEFESYDLHREKIVPGNGRITVYLGPLKPGRYEFFGEFNPATARGFLVVE
jgi:plastocyanin domain-containing protein